MLINLRMRFEQIAFVCKKIVPLEDQENIVTIHHFVMLREK